MSVKKSDDTSSHATADDVQLSKAVTGYDDNSSDAMRTRRHVGRTLTAIVVLCAAIGIVSMFFVGVFFGLVIGIALVIVGCISYAFHRLVDHG